jgi:hypothetical protein
MYKKFLIEEKYTEPNKHDLKWLLAKRFNVKFNDNTIDLHNENISYNEIISPKIVSYNSFLFFKIYSIFSFKHNSRYYQIGINNSEKQKIINKLSVSISNERVTIKDFIFFVIIILSLVWVAYNFLR